MIARIARDTAVSCLVLAVLFGLWKQTISSALAVAGGGVLIAISFWAIRSGVDGVVRRNSDETGQKSTGFSLVKFFTRHAIVALAAYGMMVRLHLDPMGLMAGVSSLGVAVAVEALRDLRWRRFL
jgi:ATP synthase I chain